MTVTVTGATGFVGRQVVRSLRERGCRVRAVIRPTLDTDLTAQDDVELRLTTDLFAESPEALQSMLAASDTLVHAAWYVEPGTYLESSRNLDCLTGTLNLARAFAAVGGKRFIGIGTCAEYDMTGSALGVDTQLNPTSLYASTKVATYHTLSHYFRNEGISFAWCRLFYLYGEGEDGARLVPYLRRQLATGQEVLLSSGEQVLDYLDVRVAGARIASVAMSHHQGPANICSGVGISIRQLSEQLADEYRRRDLLRFGARQERFIGPTRIVGVPTCEDTNHPVSVREGIESDDLRG